MIPIFVAVGGAFLAGAAITAIVAWYLFTDVIAENEDLRLLFEAERTATAMARGVMAELIRIADHGGTQRGIQARTAAARWDETLRALPYTVPLVSPSASMLRPPVSHQ